MQRLLEASVLACATAAVSAFADSPLVPVATDTSSLPEPGSLAIFALAMLGVWAIKRGTGGRRK
jgi:hypothetical protein